MKEAKGYAGTVAPHLGGGVPGSNLGPKSGDPERGILWFYSVPPEK
jgi:hypothetical protein